MGRDQRARNMARDEFSEAAKRAIAGRVGWQCSHPECNAPTVGPKADPTRIYNLGSACHIAAAAPGGPRYDANMTEEERSHPDNGIWMCRTHAKQIDDDVAEHPADLLKQWKVEAEERARRRLVLQSRIDSRRVAAAPVVAADGLGLVAATPPRPVEPMAGVAGDRPDQPREQAADLRDGRGDQLGESPLLLVFGGGGAASARRASRKAWASSDSVTWRCQPAQLRTS